MKQPLKALAIALGLTLGANCHAIELKPVDTDFTLQILGSGGPTYVHHLVKSYGGKANHES